MSSVKIHISIDEEMLSLLQSMAAREKRSCSEVVREALRQYAHGAESGNRRALAKAEVHAAIDRAAGAWSRERHPETLTPETYRKWREKLWAGDQEELDSRAR